MTDHPPRLFDRENELVRNLHVKYAHDQEALIKNLSDELQRFINKNNVDPEKLEDPNHDLPHAAPSGGMMVLYKNQGTDGEREAPARTMISTSTDAEVQTISPTVSESAGIPQVDSSSPTSLQRTTSIHEENALAFNQSQSFTHCGTPVESALVENPPPSLSQLDTPQPCISSQQIHCLSTTFACLVLGDPQFTPGQQVYLRELWKAKEAEVKQDTLRACQEELGSFLAGSPEILQLNAEQEIYLSSLWEFKEHEVIQSTLRMCQQEAQPWVQKVQELSQEMAFANKSLSQVNFDLKVARGEKQQECTKLGDEISRLKAMIAKLLSDARHAQDKYERLQSKVRVEAIETTEYERCVAENQHLKKEVETYQTRTALHFTQIEKLEDEKHEAERGWQNSKEWAEYYKTQIEGLINNNQKLAATVSAVKTEKAAAVKDHQEELHKSLASQNLLHERIETLETELAKSESNNHLLENKTESLEAANSTLQQNWDNDAAFYDRNIKELWNKYESLEKDNEFLLRNQQKPLKKCDEELKELFCQKGAMDDEFAKRMEENAESMPKNFDTCDRPVCSMRFKEINDKVRYLEEHIDKSEKMYRSIVKRSKNLLGLQMNEKENAHQQCLSTTKSKLVHFVTFFLTIFSTFFLALWALSSGFSGKSSQEACTLSLGTSTDLIVYESSTLVPSSTSTIAADILGGIAGFGYGGLDLILRVIDDFLSKVEQAEEAENAKPVGEKVSRNEIREGSTRGTIGKVNLVAVIAVVGLFVWRLFS